MALKYNYNYKIRYSLDRQNLNSDYNMIFTDEKIGQIDNTIERNILIEGVYAKIGMLNGTKDRINIILDIYKDDSKLTLINSLVFCFSPNLMGENFIKQGYEYMKSLPEFYGAIDILEPGQEILSNK